MHERGHCRRLQRKAWQVDGTIVCMAAERNPNLSVPFSWWQDQVSARWIFSHGEAVHLDAVGVRPRIHSVATAATLRRRRLRLGLSRRYNQRDGWLARPIARTLSLALSTNRTDAVSRNDREPDAGDSENQFAGVHLHRYRFRQRTRFADGFAVSFPADPGNRIAARTASRGEREYQQIQKRFSAVLRHRLRAGRRFGIRLSSRTDRALFIQPSTRIWVGEHDQSNLEAFVAGKSTAGICALSQSAFAACAR